MPARAGGCAGGRGSRARPGSWFPGVHGVVVERRSQPSLQEPRGRDSRRPGRAWRRFPGEGEAALEGGGGGGAGQGAVGAGMGWGAVEGCSPSKALSVGGLEGPRE